MTKEQFTAAWGIFSLGLMTATVGLYGPGIESATRTGLELVGLFGMVCGFYGLMRR